MTPLNFIVFYGCLLTFLVTSIILILIAINKIVEFHTTRLLEALYEIKAQLKKDSQK